MSKEINLIYGKRKEVLRKEKQLQLTRLLAVFSVVAVALMAIALFLFQQFSPLSSLSAQEQDVTQKISFLQKRIAKLFVVKQRLADITTILRTRTTYDKTIADIFDLIPPGASLDTFGISQKKVSLIITSNNLKAHQDVLAALTEKVNKKELFKKITVTSVIADVKGGKYSISLEGELL